MSITVCYPGRNSVLNPLLTVSTKAKILCHEFLSNTDQFPILTDVP